eukprot:9412595-Karenia_brevis.AAC.1
MACPDQLPLSTEAGAKALLDLQLSFLPWKDVGRFVAAKRQEQAFQNALEDYKKKGAESARKALVEEIGSQASTEIVNELQGQAF